MKTRLVQILSRFHRDERGSVTFEFVLYFSVLVVILAATIEIGHMHMRHAMLERAVEVSVRDIRLNTGDVPTFEEVRNKICEEAVIVDDCQSNLMLEMKQVSPTNFEPLPAIPDCINAQQEPRPVRQFDPGQDNDLMLIRACLKYHPILPTAGLATAIEMDEEGYAKMIVQSAFVQEPR